MRAAAAILVSLLLGTAASGQAPPDLSKQDPWKQEPWKTCLTRSDAAIGACTTIIEGKGEKPRNLAHAYTARGETYHRQGKIGHALQDFDEGLRLDPRQPEGYVSRGVLEMDNLGQDDGALRDFNHALSLRPSFTRALVLRSRLFYKKGDFARSLQDAEAVLRIEPQSPRGHTRRCLGRLAIDELEPAIADCTEALRLWPTFIPALNGRGSAYLKLGQPEHAAVDFEEAIRIRPKAPVALFGRGVSRKKLGDREGGDADIALAKQLLPDVEERFRHPWQLDQ